MAYLLDTSVLVRVANVDDVHRNVAIRALAMLRRQKESLFTTPQVFIEFRNVATRPKGNNGLGLSPADVETFAAKIEASFPIIPDDAAIFSVWKSLVASQQVIGKQVHDARLVAVCQVHSVSHLLTFNKSHFLRFTGATPGIAVVDPRDVATASN
jgi:predicted nucleic acid-binding protein